MDFSSLMGSSGSSGGGGGGWGQGLSIGGMAEQDVSGYLTSIATTKNLELGYAHAGEKLTDAYNRQRALWQPYQQGGTIDYANLRQGVNSGAYNYTPTQFQYGPEKDYGQYQQEQYQPEAPFKFGAEDVTSDPSYQFRLEQGTRAVDQSGSARGAGLSGATQKALAQYGQGFASQEFQNAYARKRGEYESNRAFGRNTYESNRTFGATEFENNRAFGRNQYAGNRAFEFGANQAYQGQMSGELANRYNRQVGLANVGLSATGQLSDIEGNYGTNMANMQLGKYGARAAGYQAGGQVAYQQGAHLQQIGGSSGMGQGGSQGGSAASSPYQAQQIPLNQTGYASSYQPMPYQNYNQQPNQNPYIQEQNAYA